MGMLAPSDPPKQYMSLCTNSQRPAPVMLLSGALSSQSDPPAVPGTIAIVNLLAALQPISVAVLPVLVDIKARHSLLRPVV